MALFQSRPGRRPGNTNYDEGCPQDDRMGTVIDVLAQKYVIDVLAFVNYSLAAAHQSRQNQCLKRRR